MIKKQWQLAIDSIAQFKGTASGDSYADISWNGEAISEAELVSKYNEVKRTLSVWEEMLEERQRLLEASDWTQARDVVLPNDTSWTAYRQALRDITDNIDPWIEDVVWPTKPE